MAQIHPQILVRSHFFEGIGASIGIALSRKRAEESLRESETRYRELFENINSGVAVYEVRDDGRDFIFKDFNKAGERIDHDQRERLIGRSIFEVRPGAEEFGLVEVLRRVWKTGQPAFHPVTLYQDDRLIGWYENFIYKLPSGEIVAVFENATARKQAEEALRESEELYRSLFENAAEGFFMASADGTLTMVNPVLRNLSGFSEEEIKGKKFLDFLHPEEVPRVAALYANVLQTNKTDLEVLEFRILSKEGRVWHFHCRPIPILHHGKITGFHGIMTNITARKQAEEARRESENKYKTLVENLPQKVFLKDRNLVYVSCNENYARDLRISPDDILGKTDFDFFPGDLAEKYRADDRRIIESGKTEDLEERYVQDGKKFDIHTLKTPVKDADGKVIGVLGIFRDITERKRLEEQLHEAMKMEAMGRLAGGVAHDFNNALTSIMAISQILLEDLASSHPIYEDIKEIRGSAERCANLTRQLLAFARRQPLEPKVLNLNEVVINIEKMLSRVIGEDIELFKSLDPELGNTKADVGQMEQIIVNLAVNARDAMPGGGKLTIETANVTLDPEYASKNLGVTPGPYVRLAMSDTGVGMDEETRAKAFEPFFTTKGPGKGTGLGLPTVYGIVKQSGGNISVYSETGQGTTLKIYLPRVEEEAEEVGGREPAPTKPLRASETILLVEDEEGVRRTTKRILIKSGYQVLEAGNGQEALELCGRHPGPIHLLITDVVMPGMSGKELTDRLALSFPAMKFLYVSGYADHAVVNHGILEAGASFLPKPFTMESLTRKVREVLDR
jgi:PAS domain S-box-containing protein